MANDLTAKDRLSKEDEDSLRAVVEILLDRAIADERKPVKRARKWRKYIAVERYSQSPYKGGPNVVTPLTRQKTDGVRAHLEENLNQEPMFLVKTDDVAISNIAPQMEQLMDNILDVTDSRVAILRAIRDAVEVGTGFVKHYLLLDADENKLPASRYVPFEDVYVYPSTPYRVRDKNFFERYEETLATIKANAQEGIYWMDRLEEEGVLDVTNDEEWNEPKELWEAWVWFRGELYEVRYSREYGLLSYRKSDWGTILGRAPYDAIYIEQSQISFWGESIPQILEGLQETNDRAFGYELARAQYAMSPPTVVSPNGELARQLRRYGGWKPGVIIEGSLDPSKDLVTPLTQMNPFNMQIMQLVGQMAEAASVPDMLIPGKPTGGRKTATEVNITTSSGSQKLKNYLHSVARGLREHAKAKWALIAHYVLRTPEAAKSSRFTWIVNGREPVPEQQARLQQMQYLLSPQFLQLVQMSQQDPFLRAVLETFLSYLDLPGLGTRYRKMMGQNGMAGSQFGFAQGAQGIPLTALGLSTGPGGGPTSGR